MKTVNILITNEDGEVVRSYRHVRFLSDWELETAGYGPAAAVMVSEAKERLKPTELLELGGYDQDILDVGTCATLMENHALMADVFALLMVD